MAAAARGWDLAWAGLLPCKVRGCCYIINACGGGRYAKCVVEEGMPLKVGAWV